MTAATAVYFLLTLWWKVPSAHEIGDFLRARAGRGAPRDCS